MPTQSELVDSFCSFWSFQQGSILDSLVDCLPSALKAENSVALVPVRFAILALLVCNSVNKLEQPSSLSISPFYNQSSCKPLNAREYDNTHECNETRRDEHGSRTKALSRTANVEQSLDWEVFTSNLKEHVGIRQTSQLLKCKGLPVTGRSWGSEFLSHWLGLATKMDFLLRPALALYAVYPLAQEFLVDKTSKLMKHLLGNLIPWITIYFKKMKTHNTMSRRPNWCIG